MGRRPRLAEVEGISVPAVFGFWRPTICLPVGTLTSLSDEELRLILRHELAHVRRRDGLIAMFVSVVRAVYWINPFTWVAVARIYAHMEQVADEVALRDENESTQTVYGRLLLHYADVAIASGQNRSLGANAVGLLFTSHGRPLRCRIQRLSVISASRHWATRLVAFAGIGLIAIVGLSDAKTRSTADAPLPIRLPQFSREVSDYPENNVPPVVVRQTYDASAAIAKISSHQPEVDASRQFMLNQPESSQLIGIELVVTDVASMQRQVQDSIAAIENSGHWCISYELRFLQADVRILQDMDIAWQNGAGFGSDVTPMPNGAVLLYQPQPTTGALNEDLSRSHSTENTFTVEQVHDSSRSPLLGARLQDAEVRELIRRCSGDSRATIVLAPKLTLFNGQSGKIHDVSYRPFVVDVRSSIGDSERAFQSIIQVFPDGTQFQVQGQVDSDERVDIQCELTLSSVSDVWHAHLPYQTDDGKLVTIQVPKVHSITMRANSKLNRQETLLLVAPTAVDPQLQDGNPAEMCFLVRATWSRER